MVQFRSRSCDVRGLGWRYGLINGLARAVNAMDEKRRTNPLGTTT